MQIVKEIKQDKNLANKLPQLIDKIVSGKIEKFYNLNCLMEQTYIRDDSITVEQFIKQAIFGLDVRINMTEFFRYEKSEDL
jgi:elongation factor Ts